MRIAMWSGPRNLSTAMMYSFASRADMAVMDEPFYAAYLAQTGLEHPMRDEILAAQPTDPVEVVARITTPVALHSYQKHMCHHMLPGFPCDWMEGFTNIFLIRHPARVIASYAAKREQPTLADIGFTRQAEMFDELRAAGQVPVVIDSHDIRQDPEAMLRALCAEIGLTWDAAMLSWPAGGIAEDGVWAKHWYGAVWRSTGFAGPEGPLPEVPAELAGVERGAMEAYEHLKRFRIRPWPPAGRASPEA